MFYLAAKGIWWLIRPESLLIWALIGIWWSLRRGWVRLARRIAGTLALGMTALAVLPLGNLLLGPLEARYPANPPLTRLDGLIILGGGERPVFPVGSGLARVNESGERFLVASALAHRFPEAQVVFTGSNGAGTRAQAEAAHALLTAAGIDPARITLEDRSRDTWENAVFTRDIIGAETENWALVTSAWHMPRAMSVFCRAGFRGLIPYPVDHRAEPMRDRLGWKLAENLADLNTGAREWIGLTAYRLAGRSTSVLPGDCPDS